MSEAEEDFESAKNEDVAADASVADETADESGAEKSEASDYDPKGKKRSKKIASPNKRGRPSNSKKKEPKSLKKKKLGRPPKKQPKSYDEDVDPEAEYEVRKYFEISFLVYIAFVVTFFYFFYQTRFPLCLEWNKLNLTKYILQVKSIVGHREYNGKLVYKIRWKNYDSDDDTWEDFRSLSCPDLLEMYNLKVNP